MTATPAGQVKRVYWTNSSYRIQSANVDGTDLRTIYSRSGSLPRAIQVDPIAGKIYWVEYGLKRIMRANLDGTDAVPVLTNWANIQGLAIDPRDRMYYGVYAYGEWGSSVPTSTA